MKHILLGLLFIFATCHCYSKIEKLSTNEAVEILKLMDNIDRCNGIQACTALMERFNNLTGVMYEKNIRKELYDIIDKNTNKTSFYAKMAGLVSFQNIILVCLLLVGTAFTFSLMSDLFILCSVWISLLFYKIILRKEIMYIEGLIISFVTMYLRIEEINTRFRFLFIFDWLTPVFGCIVFYIAICCFYTDYFNSVGEHKINMKIIDILTIIIWGLVAQYHNNWMVGVITIMMFFNTFGFSVRAMIMGYEIGFNSDNSMFRCMFISNFFTVLILLCRMEIISGSISKYLMVFETGIYFWAALVGSIALLIMSDEYYLMTRNRNDLPTYLMAQFSMALHCLMLMFFGNVLYIPSYCSIGGTFFVLWGLNIERTFLNKFKKCSTTLFLFIIMVNLYGLKQLISLYPEYFIF